jgi:diaminopimelate decarboxylase
LRREHGIVLSFIDIGGGFASHNTLKAQYLPGDQSTPSFDRYAEAVCDGLSDLDYPAQELPTLVLETGRALVDDAGTLLATVVANKRLPDGSRALVIDAGVNLLFTSFWYQHEVIPTRDHGSALEPTVIYGPLCMNIDVIRDAVLFPPMQAGEHIGIRNVGAYNVTQWMQFITYRPAVVMVAEDGTTRCIRRPETLDTILAQEPEED